MAKESFKSREERAKSSTSSHAFENHTARIEAHRKESSTHAWLLTNSVNASYD